MFEAKQRMIDEIVKALGGYITAEAAGNVRNAVRDVTDDYEVRAIETASDGPDDLVEVYINALRVEGRSPKTLARYQYVLGRMLEAVKVPTRRVTVYDLRGYLAAEKQRGIKDSTLEGLRQIFSAYFGWLAREGIISRNPAGNLGAIKSPKVLRKAFGPDDIERLKSACRCARERAVLHFLISTGCRVSELTGLNREDVNINRLECIVHGKGNKERTVYLDTVAGNMLAEYLNTRKNNDAAMFVNRLGQRITPAGVRDMLVKIGRRAGVENVHPHRFRRTLATNLIRRGMQIQEVGAILGHDRLDTTMKYVVLCHENIKNAYQRYA